MIDPKIALSALVEIREPSFFPLPDGGLLAKWTSDDGGSLHIEFDAEDAVMVLDDRSTGLCIAGDFAALKTAAFEWLTK